jgi:hypothetical protein
MSKLPKGPNEEEIINCMPSDRILDNENLYQAWMVIY